MDPVQFSTFAEFLASGLETSVTEVSISGVVYRLRDTQPLHDDYRHQDSSGMWWSPDYYVVVAGGQSNMVGSAAGGAMVENPNVQFFDHTTGTIIDASYSASVISTGGRNNLYIPYANAIAEDLGRPVLIIAQPVSGSRIDSWLESGSGHLWDALDASVRAALGLVGQSDVDSFIWLQGESDFPLRTEAYQALLTEFIGQVRGADWAGDAMAMLIGELSREGVNANQNVALQALEIAMRDDPLLRFVSSTGLNSNDQNGVHFDGPALVALGERFFAALQEILAGGDPGPVNEAPVVTLAPDAPTELVLYEGESLSLSPYLFFSDPEGDTLWLYGSHSRRSQYFLSNVDGDLVLSPRFDAAGTYRLYVYASDGQLDSVPHELSVTVLDRPPLVHLLTMDYARVISGYADLDLALVAAVKSRAIDILHQDAVSDDGPAVVGKDNLKINGAAGIHADLVLAAGVLRVTLDGAADFSLVGNADGNTIFGNLAGNLIDGMDGLDRIYGGGGNDSLIGGSGQDFLYGGEGDDTLTGGEGDDRLYGDVGQDLVNGGDGNENIYGGDGGDSLQGEAGNDRLFGDAGVDLLEGGDGNDYLYGGLDVDQLLGGVGADRQFGDAGNDLILSGDDNDYAFGGDGTDTLAGEAGNDWLYGGAGEDSQDAGEGNDFLYGGDGADSLAGGAGADRLFGDLGDDLLEAGDDADFLYGGEGNDLLRGGAGDDRLYGNAGDDRIEAGGGRDQAWGGTGADTFVFGPGQTQLIIRDMVCAEDRIEFSADPAIHDLAGLLAAAQVVDFGSLATGGVRVILDGSEMLIYGARAADLTEDLFLFV